MRRSLAGPVSSPSPHLSPGRASRPRPRSRRSSRRRAIARPTGDCWSSTRRPGRSVYREERRPDVLPGVGDEALLDRRGAGRPRAPIYRFRTPVVRKGEVDEHGHPPGRPDPRRLGRPEPRRPDGARRVRSCSRTTTTPTPAATTRPRSSPADPLARARRPGPGGRGGRGSRRSTGDVLVDDRLFEHAESTGSGPSRVTPIVVNDNLVDVVVTPGAKPGEPATVRTRAGHGVSSSSTPRSRRSPPGEPADGRRSAGVGPRGIVVRGRVPVGHKPVVRIFEVDEPASFARALFIEALRRKGVEGRGLAAGAERRDGRCPPRAEVAALPRVAEYTSPPFRESSKVILKVSHNLHASTLPMLLAAHHGETTPGSGLQSARGDPRRSLGVDVDAIALRRRRRRGAGGPGDAPGDRRLAPGHGRPARFRGLRGGLARARPRRHAGQGRPPRQPRPGPCPGQDGDVLGRQPAQRQGRPDEQGPRRLHRRRHGPPLVFAFFLNNVPMLDARRTRSTTPPPPPAASWARSARCFTTMRRRRRPAWAADTPTRPTGSPGQPKITPEVAGQARLGEAQAQTTWRSGWITNSS